MWPFKRPSRRAVRKAEKKRAALIDPILKRRRAARMNGQRKPS